MPRKTPLGRIKDAASETIKDPIGTATRAAGQAIEQARGGMAVGRTVAGQVVKGAAGVVASRGAGRKATAPGPVGGPAGGGGLTAVRAEEPLKSQGDPVQPVTKAAPAKKTTAKQAPAKKTAAKKTAAKKAPAKRAAPKKAPAKKASTSIDAAADPARVHVTPADVARKVPESKAAAKRTVKKSAASSPSGRLPARKATPES